MANNGGIAITDKSKLTVTKVTTTMDDMATDLQASLRGATFANGDVIYQFEVERNKKYKPSGSVYHLGRPVIGDYYGKTR